MQREKKPFFDYKNWIFQSPKNRIFFKPMLLAKKMPSFSLFKFDQTKPRNNAFWRCRERKTLFGLKEQNFAKSKKSAFPKLPFFLCLDLIKITLEIMLSDFAKKKEFFLTLKKKHFSKSKQIPFFQGITHAFDEKIPIIWFI